MHFLVKNFSKIILFLSSLTLLYLVYRIFFVYNPQNTNIYLYYTIINIFIILLSIVYFFLKNKTKEIIVVIALSIIFSLYLFEAFLTFNNSILLKLSKGKNYDHRTKLGFYEDTKKIDDNITVILYPTTLKNKEDKILPLSGLSNVRTITCNENGYFSIYDSDRYGFNNPDGEWESNELEYLLVGDSFANGYCVNRPYDIGSQLRLLSKKNVLNLGYPRNGPLKNYATLREYLTLKVKNIIWLHYEENDLNNLNTEIKNKILNNYLIDKNFSQNLITKNNIKDFLLKLSFEEKFKNRDKLSNLYLRFFIFSKTREFIFELIFKPDIQKPKLKEFKKILNFTKILSEKNNSNLYFVYLGEFNRYKKKYKNDSYQKIKKITNDLEIPFIDIHTEVFQKQSNPLIYFPFQKYGHYNEDGYEAVSKFIYSFTK